MGDRSLSELLQQAEQLTSYMDTSAEDLPRVDRTLSQILHSGESLWPRTPASAQDAQASILLGARGLDLPHISHKLESISSVQPIEPLELVADTDIATFLRNERESAIITAIEDAKRQTSAEVEKLFWEQQKAEWEQAKQNLMSVFTHTGTDLLSLTIQPQDSTFAVMPSGTKSTLTNEEVAYMQVVTHYNAEILQGGIRPNLAETLAKCSSSFEDDGVKDLWSLVKCFTEIPVSLVKDATHARTSHKVQSAIVTHARQHLEKNYKQHMIKLVHTQAEKAKLGGVPGLTNLVRAYLSVILPSQAQLQLEDGHALRAPVWPLIFYCLRAGGIGAAVSAADENSSPAVLEVASALKELEKSDSGRLLPEAERKLRLSYKRCAKTLSDPFKRVVYCILARCDSREDHRDIITTTDDYLWLKLYMVDMEDSSQSSTLGSAQKQDLLTLVQLQNLIYEQYGETHFNAWEQPLLYTSTLFLTGQFEAGIEFLSRIDRLLCHAVHLALALNELSLMALPSQVNGPMLSREDGDPPGIRRLNLTRLILLFTRRFEISDPGDALHYCFFLRNLMDKNDRNVFTGCISELVLHSQEFEMLLGKINPDGSRTPGLVDKFKVDITEVTEMVANDSEMKGLHEDAIKLYDLAKNHMKVLSLLNQLLAQVVNQTTQSGAGSQRDRVIDLATSIALRFKTYGHSAAPNALATLHLLLDLATFFDLCQQEKYSDALEVLSRLKLIALTRSEVERRVSSLSSFGVEVKSVLPHILLSAMNATYKLSKASEDTMLKATRISILNSSQQSLNIKHLQDQARAIVTFAGMTSLRLHADVNARLVELEALIN